MKFLKKFKDWKVWVFIVLPIAMIIALFAIGIYLYVNPIYNIPLIITMLALLPIACLLIFCYKFDRFIKQSRIWRTVLSIALMLCFLGLQIAWIVKTPNLISAYQEKQRLYEILEETSSDDEEFSEQLHAWSSANTKYNNARTTSQFLFYGSLWALTLASIASPSVKRSPNENSDKNEEPQE
ncbi:MAG: hypothetical protein ACI4MS_03950 [Candidatus Coproplasma sp.]